MKLIFPLNGIHRGLHAEKQPDYTAFEIVNCRALDPLSGRLRGGQRPGLDKWGAGTQIGAAAQPVVAMINVQSLR